MDYRILVKPRSSRDEVYSDGETLVVYVSDPPADGKSNKKVIKLLSNYFDVSKSQIEIISGFKSRNKVIRVERYAK